MKHYTKIVSFDVAKKLSAVGYTKTTGLQYDESGNLCDPAAPGGYSGVCEAPTYAEALDFLLDKGIFISLNPYFTFATSDRLGFDYTVCRVREDEPKLEKYVDEDFASFWLSLDLAIEKAIKLLS